jgi:hypothetical protein
VNMYLPPEKSRIGTPEGRHSDRYSFTRLVWVRPGAGRAAGKAHLPPVTPPVIDHA